MMCKAGSRGRAHTTANADDYRVVAAILEVAADRSGHTAEQIAGARRDAALVRWRHRCMYAVRDATALSYPALGRIFDRDHTTVMYAIGRVERSTPERVAALELVAAARDLMAG